MSQQEHLPPPLPPQSSIPFALNYRAAEPSNSQRIIWQSIAGAVLTWISLVVALILLILLAVGCNNAIPSVILGLSYLALINWIAFRLRHHMEYRGWAIGIWIGLSVAGLMIGGCFALIIHG